MTPPVAPLLDADDIRVTFVSATGGHAARHIAVDGVSLSLEKGHTTGLVGESGCGKTTLGRVLARFHKPDSGRVVLDGENIYACSGRELRRLRRGIQMIFQNPFASLNPRLTVGATLSEALQCAGGAASGDCSALLDQVGLDRFTAGKFPHEMSGGQRQRVAIARALAVHPKVIIADEPVSSLDVSVAAQIINLFEDIREQLRLTMLFISHDLSVVRYIADRVIVMYQGRIVEQGFTDDLFGHPMHPYTANLIRAIPTLPSDDQDRPFFERVLPASDVPVFSEGCPYAPRCEARQPRCTSEKPAVDQNGKRGTSHVCACFFPY